MANFTSLELEANNGDTGSPNYVVVSGANREIRWSDLSDQTNVASASWPAVVRPQSGTAGVDYAYAFTADAVGQGIYSGASNPPAAYANTQYLWGRWNWDNTGTMASAPIFTAYPTSAHGAISRGDGSLLGGHATDTGGTARSYLKGFAYGITASQETPGAGPTAPVVTDGVTGARTTSTGAWPTAQGLQGDNDYIQCGDTPPAVTARFWYIQMRMFVGEALVPSSYVNVVSLKYTWT